MKMIHRNNVLFVTMLKRILGVCCDLRGIGVFSILIRIMQKLSRTMFASNKILAQLWSLASLSKKRERERKKYNKSTGIFRPSRKKYIYESREHGFKAISPLLIDRVKIKGGRGAGRTRNRLKIVFDGRQISCTSIWILASLFLSSFSMVGVSCEV